MVKKYLKHIKLLLVISSLFLIASCCKKHCATKKETKETAIPAPATESGTAEKKHQLDSLRLIQMNKDK